jgi:ribosomal-protein-alanine N-acetyltransferase
MTTNSHTTRNGVKLTGSKVILRDFELDDVPASLKIVGDDRVTQFLSFDSRTEEQARSMITGAIERRQVEPRTEFYLAVTTRGDGELVGFVRIALSGVKAAKLGYSIAADHWGQGFATDAARTMISFGFEELGLHRITAAIGPDNVISMAVVEKLGFVREGQLRDHVFTNGAWRDSVLFSILEPDWKPA